MAKPSWEGRTLGGRYQIGELLGHGGMSSVYRAFDPNLKRDVAVKIIHTHLSDQPDFVERFEREAASVAQLRHPNIIQVHDFSHEDNIYYIVFEYIAGENLQDRLKRLSATNQYMPLSEVKKVIISLANALDYAHGKGIVHRDIKPANVMLNDDNEPILMDFGITKIIGGGKQTATGITLGTVQYMSPEQIKGLPVDARTDIYALGITLFEMLGGRSPFEANSTMAVMMMHVQSPVPDPRVIRNNIPPVFVDILNKAMAKEPQERYQRALDMARDMRWTQDEMTPLGATIVDYGGYQQVADADKTLLDVDDYRINPGTAPATEVISYGSDAGGHANVMPMPYAPPNVTGQNKGKRSPVLLAGLVVILLALLGGAVWFFGFRGPSVADRVEEANAMVVAGQYNEAIAAFEEILLEEPGEETAVAGLDAAIFARAQAAIDLGNDEEAEADLTRLLVEKPDDVTLNILMADLLARQERFADALPFYDAVLRQDDELVDAYLGAGQAAYELANYNRALDYFSEAVVIAPGNAEAYAGQGKSYYALNWYEEALKPLQEWSNIEPADPEPYKYLGQAYVQVDNPENALQQFRRWGQLADDDSEILDAKLYEGETLFALGLYAEAAEVFEQAIDQNPDSLRGWSGLGYSYQVLREYENALLALENASELEPDNPFLIARIAEVYFLVENYDDAATYYEKAISIDNSVASFHNGLGNSLRALQNYLQAISAYQQAIELEPNNPLILARIASSYFALEDYGKAINYYEEAVSLDNTVANFFSGLANSHRELRNFSQAIAAYKQAAELEPNNALTFARIGSSYLALEDYGEARSYYQQAITLDNNVASYFNGYGQSLRQLGNCEEAISAFERALEIDPTLSVARQGIDACRTDN